jgi:CheY-like chemotaxis protein
MAKILWLDDNDTLLESIKDNLGEIHGHDITGVTKISHAIEELSGFHFDLVVCDGDLVRNGDGADFAAQLKEQFQRENWKTKIAICSADPRNRREGVPFKDKMDSQPLHEFVASVLQP